MRAEDLMIGDWYAFRGHPYKCTASDIASIAECEEIGAPTDISEIPLTDEILEKNKMREFEHRNPGQGDNLIKKWWHKDGSYYVSLYSVGDKYTYTVGDSITRVCRIRYVHELQHALRLCGIEKEIQI